MIVVDTISKNIVATKVIGLGHEISKEMIRMSKEQLQNEHFDVVEYDKNLMMIQYKNTPDEMYKYKIAEFSIKK